MCNFELRQKLTVAETIEDLALQWYYFCERQKQPREPFGGVSTWGRGGSQTVAVSSRKPDLSYLDGNFN